MRSLDKRIEYPRRGELVVATVKEIRGHGAYLHIEDYNIKGYLPITEISSKWVRRIDDIIKPGQKIVVKVLRIDRFTRSIDVSLKEVSDKEKNRILRTWKRNKRGIQILDEFKRIYRDKGEKIEEKLQEFLDEENTVYDALEKILREPSLLDKYGLFSDEKKLIINFLSRKIRLKKYVYEAIIKVRYIGKGGVYKIKEALSTVYEELERKTNEKNINIYNDGSPRYKLKIWSHKPEVIRRKAVPSLREIIKKLSKKVEIEIIDEELKVEA